jgi:hypothetical protein
MGYRFIAMALLVSACDPPPVTVENVERVVTIGDNSASNPSLKLNGFSLLANNDAELFPDFPDLATRRPGLEVVRLDRGGDSYRGLAANTASLCVCGACNEDTCLDPEDERATVLLVQLGVNDLFATFMHLISSDELRADPTPELDETRAAIHTVLGLSQDETLFPRKPLVVVANVYDPSDGVGDLADLAGTVFPVPDAATEVTPELALSVLASFNTAITEESSAINATVADVHSAFLGHGLHYDETDTPHYDAEDPTLWFRGFIDPNLRGAHEIRRVFWKTLTGEDITTIPTDLPPEAAFGLPEVPDDGWSDALVDSNILQEWESETLGVVPNAQPDGEEAVGAASGDLGGTVALGSLGSFVVVELAEEAIDGEGDDILVIEWGPLSGGTPEPYRVAVSDNAAGPFTTLGDGAGERTFNLADIGVARARYVRVESQVQPADLEHIGSPFFPGPEIDAIAALHTESSQ